MTAANGPRESEAAEGDRAEEDRAEEDTVIGIHGAEGALSKLIEPDDIDGNTIIVSGGGMVGGGGGGGVGVGVVDERAVSAIRRSPVVGEGVVEQVPQSTPPSSPQSEFALRIGTHAPITLEVPAYIGRRPSTPRITGTRMPRLVMVPSPSREVSSTHVEIREEADTVVVTDLGSTNGTKVTVPGSPPRQLRQGESLVIGAGAWVDIGDGIRISIERHPERLQTEGAL